MADAAKVAMAVGAGYLLGRTRKAKLALMLAAAGVTGKFPARPADLVAHGLKTLTASTDLSPLTEQLRGELLGAVRSATLTAATHQVDALNDRLQGVTSAVGADEVLGDVGDTVDEVAQPVTSLAGLRPTRSAREEDLDERDELYDEEDEEEPLELDEDIDEEEEPDEADYDEEPEEDEEPEPPVRRRRATRQPASPRASVRRSTRAAAHEEPTTRAARRRSTAAVTKRAPVRRGR